MQYNISYVMLSYILGQLLIKITRAWANISVHTKKEKKYTSFHCPVASNHVLLCAQQALPFHCRPSTLVISTKPSFLNRNYVLLFSLMKP